MHSQSLSARRKISARLRARALSHLGILVRALAVLAAASAASAHAQHDLGIIGGAGGDAFRALCDPTARLTGIEVRSGAYVDALRPVCFDASGLVEGEWQGGFGGGVRRVICPVDVPFVVGLFVGTHPDESVVHDLQLYCSADAGGASSGVSASLRPGQSIATHDDTQGCGPGLVASGLHGRSGKYIDALGLVCDALRTATPPTRVASIGRTSGATAVDSRPAGWTICDSARDARARNSPAAPRLEAQCRESPPPMTGLGNRIPPSSTPPDAGTPPIAPPQPPPPAPPTEREQREMAVQALINAVASTVQEVRDGANRSRSTGSASRRVDGNNDRRRRDPPSRDASGADREEQDSDAYQTAQPDGSIHIKVSYPVTYGYSAAAGPSGFGANSCGAFYVSAIPFADIRPREPTRIDTGSTMRDDNGSYECDYLIHDQPVGAPVIVRVAMADPRAAVSATWLGGSQPQPPAGQRRTILDGDRQVLLTTDRPSAALRFTMVYAGAR